MISLLLQTLLHVARNLFTRLGEYCAVLPSSSTISFELHHKEATPKSDPNLSCVDSLHKHFQAVVNAAVLNVPSFQSVPEKPFTDKSAEKHQEPMPCLLSDNESDLFRINTDKLLEYKSSKDISYLDTDGSTESQEIQNTLNITSAQDVSGEAFRSFINNNQMQEVTNNAVLEMLPSDESAVHDMCPDNPEFENNVQNAACVAHIVPRLINELLPSSSSLETDYCYNSYVNCGPMTAEEHYAMYGYSEDSNKSSCTFPSHPTISPDMSPELPSPEEGDPELVNQQRVFVQHQIDQQARVANLMFDTAAELTSTPDSKTGKVVRARILPYPKPPSPRRRKALKLIAESQVVSSNFKDGDHSQDFTSTENHPELHFEDEPTCSSRSDSHRTERLSQEASDCNDERANRNMKALPVLTSQCIGTDSDVGATRTDHSCFMSPELLSCTSSIETTNDAQQPSNAINQDKLANASQGGHCGTLLSENESFSTAHGLASLSAHSFSPEDNSKKRSMLEMSIHDLEQTLATHVNFAGYKSSSSCLIPPLNVVPLSTIFPGISYLKMESVEPQFPVVPALFLPGGRKSTCIFPYQSI